jgi:hypothetical protein
MDPEALQTLLVDFAPMFAIILGMRAQELDGGVPRGIGAPLSRRPGA